MILPGMLDPLDDWDAADTVAGPVSGQAGKAKAHEVAIIKLILKGQR